MAMIFAQRKKRLGLLSGTGLLIGLGIVVLGNLLADRFFVRLDLTAGGRYSLSPATRSLLNALEDPVVIRLYLTPRLPQPYQSQGRYIQELLREYQTAGRGKVAVERRVPDGSDAMTLETRRLNIQPADITQVASDQFQVLKGYMGLVLFYQDKQDVIPFVNDVSNLEYEISSRLRVMTQKSKKTLFFVSNHSEVSPDVMRQGPAARLFDEFAVESVSLPLPAEGRRPDAVFLLGPQTALKPEEIDTLDRWVSTGIPVVAALNRRIVNAQTFRSIAQSTNLEPWLEHYGVRVERDFVMDERAENIGMRSAQTTFFVKYWPFTSVNDLNPSNPATRGVDVLNFFYAHPLTFTGAPSLRATVLARSSKRSWIWPGLYNVDPASLFTQAKSEPPADFVDKGQAERLGPFPLALLVEGSTTSFRDPLRPVPALKLVVVGTSFFANPQLPNRPENALFILSLAQWLTQEGTYLSIPPKSSPFRPVKPLSPAGRGAIKGVGYFLVPALVLSAALLHRRRRRVQRDRVRREFLHA